MESKIHPGVKIGADCHVGEYCIIGEPPRGKKPGELSTHIGKDSVIRSHSVIYAGNVIGEGFEAGHGVMIRENNVIGKNVSIGTHTVVERDCTIGDGARLHSNVFAPEYTMIEKGAWIGPNVVLTNARFPKSPAAKENLHGVTVMENAKIGANSTILPGVRVGRSSLVGAGSVVTEDVPENTVVAGNPAKRIKSISDLAYENGKKAY